MAADGKLAHGYLFFGSPRSGKKLFASHLANFLETGDFSEPKKILTDFLSVGQDAEGTIGIDQMRQLKNFLWQKPMASSRRTAVIDDSEAMTSEAQNAILKIAEEPPESSLLIIISSDPERLWPTLVSRLQKVYFGPVSSAVIEKWLTGTIKCKTEEARKFAADSHGQPGLALLMASSDDFRFLCQSAEKFLKSGFWERRNIIKSMLENEKFRMSAFLEAILIIISKNAVSEKNFNLSRTFPENPVILPRSNIQQSFSSHGLISSGKARDLWHKVSALRRDSESYNINPRLQLEALLGG